MPDDEDRPSNRWGWIGIAVAVAFVCAAAGYAVGLREGNDDGYSSLDIGFMHDMTDHHDQAVEMALLARDRAEDPVVRDFASEVLLFQRYEIGLMDAWLTEAGANDRDVDREAMTWMDMSTSVADMPGMATQQQLDDLASLEGRAFDLEFLRLMRAHHEGGLHMADYAEDNASNADVREFAARVARNQTIEVREYTAEIGRLESATAG